MADSKQKLENGYKKLLTTLEPGATTDDVASIYDELAEQYEDVVGANGYDAPSKLAKIFEGVCNDKSANIVDWGSGVGLAGAKLLERGFTNLTAVEISQKSLDVSAKNGIYQRYVKLGDSKTLFKTDEFDAVVCCGCLVPNHVSPDIFYEWTRIVKPGGIIAVAMRREYIHLTEGRESKFSEELKTGMETVLRDLETKGNLELLSKGDFDGYYVPVNWIGRKYVYRVCC